MHTSQCAVVEKRKCIPFPNPTQIRKFFYKLLLKTEITKCRKIMSTR